MQPKELINQIYADYGRGDIDAALENCDHSFTFVFAADERFSRFAGASVDKQGFRETAAALRSEFEYLAVQQIDMIAEGDRVAVRNEMRMKRRATGQEFTLEVADFWTIRDGKAIELVEFYDTALVKHLL